MKSIFSDKTNAICLLKILEEYSDERHILPMRELIAKLNAQYGINPDRRTVYGAIGLLNDVGYDISTYEDNGRGYFLRARLFEPGEVRLLTDAVYSFPFLPPRHTSDLIAKLQRLVSVHARKRLRHLTVVRREMKSQNRQVMFSAEVLDEAIERRVKVKFTYLRYDTNKELVARREKKYTVNPYKMVYTNEQYYLVCSLEGKENVSLYRIDRMRDIELTDASLDEREPGFDAQKSVNQAVFAFTGEPESIVLHCDRDILDNVIDKFGTDIRIRELDGVRLEIRLRASPRGIKFWALQYLPFCEVTEPEWVRAEIVESIKGNNYGVE
jgi:predicted DNA-binding transcriptional regulator YafY